MEDGINRPEKILDISWLVFGSSAGTLDAHKESHGSRDQCLGSFK
jgi:hypothetical protein